MYVMCIGILLRYVMLVQMRTFYIYVCHDSMLIFDKNHGVSNVQTGPITRSNAKKIQQTFILHLQNWIDSVQPSFHVLQADLIEQGPFGASEVNICTVEVADEIASIIS